jgi:hypothetical protein
MPTKWAIAVICGVLAMGPRAGHANTITVHVNATVSGVATVDTYGLFGAPGAYWFGQPLDIKLTYDSDQYRKGKSCGTGCRSHDTIPGSTRQAATVKVTIAGVTVVYKSMKSGQLQFYNDGPGNHSFGIAADGDLSSMTGSGAGVLVWCIRQTRFDAPIIRKNRDTDRPQDYFIAYSASNGNSEEISFAIE